MRSALEKILLVKLSLKSPIEGQKLWRRDGSSNLRKVACIDFVFERVRLI